MTDVLTALDLLRQVEHSEGATEDVFGSVALDALRAGAPADHPTVGVEHQHGVVTAARNEEAEVLFAVP